jgi:DNA-binding NtrC family response regulator
LPEPAHPAPLLGAIIARGGSLGFSCPSSRSRAKQALCVEVDRVKPVGVPILTAAALGTSKEFVAKAIQRSTVRLQGNVSQ